MVRSIQPDLHGQIRCHGHQRITWIRSLLVSFFRIHQMDIVCSFCSSLLSVQFRPFILFILVEYTILIIRFVHHCWVYNFVHSFHSSLLSVRFRSFVLLVIVKHSLGVINIINAVVLTDFTYRGYSLRCNSVEVLKDIIIYSILSLTNNKANIERLQGERLSLFTFFIFKLTV